MTHAEVGDAIYGKFHQFGCRILGITGNPDLPVIILHPVLESHERNQTVIDYNDQVIRVREYLLLLGIPSSMIFSESFFALKSPDVYLR